MDYDGEHNLADSDIVALSQRYLDGELSTAQQSALFGRLRSDGLAQTLFVRSLMQAAYLDELLAQHRSAQSESTPHDESSAGINGLAGRAPSASAPMAAPVDFPAAGDSAASAFGSAHPWNWLFGWPGIGLASVVVAVVSGVLLLSGRHHAEVAERPRQETMLAAPAPDVFDARTVRIDSGSARITLPKVGYMLIDGPAEVDLIHPRRARLLRGRIRVRVTEATGHGFVVETPDGEIADLSTEFGLDVVEGKKTGVVVFDGAVDLHLGKSEPTSTPRVERLVGGEGVTFNKLGELDRIVSIVTGKVATFQSSREVPNENISRVIAHVADNIRAAELKNFYEIVPGGLKEDALTYADRPAHDWNGVDSRGMPAYLIGADYVKTFNIDKMRRDVEISVTLARPAGLFVFLDDRVSPPDWLRADFRDTGDDIGLDAGECVIDGVPLSYRRDFGPGRSLDATFSVWERAVTEAGTVKLGPNSGASVHTGMYAIAAVGLEQK